MEKPIRRAIFFAHSPFNLFVSTGIALSLSSAETKDLVMYLNFPGIPEALDLLRSWSGFPFRKVVTLDRQLDRQSLLKKLRMMKLNIQAVFSSLQTQPPHSIYFFNDNFPSCQFALAEAAKMGTHVDRVFVDEGSGAYNTARIQPPLKGTRLFRQLALGSWWEEINTNGTSSYVDRSLLMFPARANPELLKKPVAQLQAASFLTPAMREMALHYLRCAGVNPSGAPLSLLVFPTLSDVPYTQTQAYRRELQEVCSQALALGLLPGVKYHPNERRGDYCDLEKLSQVKLLPASVPAEILYLTWAHSIQVVVGDISTALITVRWLLDTAEAFTLRPFTAAADQRLLSTLKRIGVHVIENAKELARVII
jgi:hypothetical protein